MASLNAEAPEFFYRTSLLSYSYHPLPIFNPYPTTTTTTYFYQPYYTPPHPSPCFTNFAVSTYCNSDVFHVGQPQWQSNPLPSLPSSSSSIVHILPSYVDQSNEVEKNVVSEEIVERVGTKGDCKGSRVFVRRRSRREEIEAYSKREKVVWLRKGGVVSGEKSYGSKIEAKRGGGGGGESEPIQREGTKTTVMIRNIPNKYTRGMLLDFLDKHCMEENNKEQLELENPTTVEENCSSAFDFLYLPMDFGSKCNKGYAFVNFTDPKAVWKLHLSLHNHPWGVLNSKKICEITYARIQGKDALIKHFQKSTFACETDEFLPTYFNPYRDGSGVLVQQFTVGRRLTSFLRQPVPKNH